MFAYALTVYLGIPYIYTCIYVRETPNLCTQLFILIMNNGDTDEPHNPGIDVIPYCVHKILTEKGGVFVDYLTAQVFVRNQNI